MSTRHLFVYGTLRPGEVRWHHLARWVVDEGQATTVAGDVYDTGLDYPAAVFGGDGQLHGRVYELVAETADEALAHLDEVEGAVRGLYHRLTVRTESGLDAWAYQCGDEALLVRLIETGDWLTR